MRVWQAWSSNSGQAKSYMQLVNGSSSLQHLFKCSSRSVALHYVGRDEHRKPDTHLV